MYIYKKTYARTHESWNYYEHTTLFQLLQGVKPELLKLHYNNVIIT